MMHHFETTQAIARTLHSYLDSAQSGRTAGLKEDWYPHLIVTGTLDALDMHMQRDDFCTVVENIEPSPGTQGKIVRTDITGNAACTQIEFFTPGGYRFTDYILLYREQEQWKACAKVFDAHMHYSSMTQAHTYACYEAIEQVICRYTEALRSGQGMLLLQCCTPAITLTGTPSGVFQIRHLNEYITAINETGPKPHLQAIISALHYNGMAACATLRIRDAQDVYYTIFMLLHYKGRTAGWQICGIAETSM